MERYELREFDAYPEMIYCMYDKEKGTLQSIYKGKHSAPYAVRLVEKLNEEDRKNKEVKGEETTWKVEK